MVKELLDHLPHPYRLHRLCMAYNFRLNSLAGLEVVPGLTDLDCSGCYYLREFEALTSLRGLQQLNLHGVYLGSKGAAAAALSRALMHATLLKWLDLGKTALDVIGVSALVGSLQGLSGLQFLDLDQNNFGPQSAAVLAPALQALTRLQCLHLGGNNLGATGATFLSISLSRLSNMQRLCLAGNDLGGGGAAVLAPALKALPGLLHLDLGNNNLQTTGASILTPALTSLTKLQSLSLLDNRLGISGVAVLAPAFMALTGLRELQLEDYDPLNPMAEARAISALAPLLGSASPAVQENAVIAFRAMSVRLYSKQQDRIIAAGAIPRLVTLLGSGSEKARMAAAEALCYLSDNFTDNIDPAVAIPTMVTLLGSRSEAMQLWAVNFLRTLSLDPGDMVEVALSGAIPALVALLIGSKSSGVRDAARNLLKVFAC